MSGDQFQVVVGNGIATSTSAVATLTVTQAPAITSANSAYFVVGTAGTFTATATGSPAVTFSVASGTFPAWASLNTSTGVISGTPANTVGSPFTFVLQAANGVSPAATQNFTLTVSPTPVVPVFSVQPASTSVTINQAATFTAAATGTPAPTYQWQRQPAGTSGFGYDPIFMPAGWDLTTAQMTPDQKDAISHRGQALRALAARLVDQS
mgnify:CR=1 FL=1